MQAGAARSYFLGVFTKYPLNCEAFTLFTALKQACCKVCCVTGCIHDNSIC